MSGGRGSACKAGALLQAPPPDLVRANAKAANGRQLLGRLEHALGELGLAADADDVHVLDGLNQLVLVVLDLGGWGG